MMPLALTASTIAALLMTSAAAAATITNRSDTEVKLAVTEGSGKQEHTLAAGKVLDGVCQKGCIIRLVEPKGDDYELNGSDRVLVDEGYVYYESLAQEGAPKSGSGSEGQTRPK